MKILQAGIFSFLFEVGSAFSIGAIAQEVTFDQLQSELVSPWIVTLESDQGTRTFSVQGATKKTDGTIVLDATWGRTGGGKQNTIPATASQFGGVVTIQFVAPSGAKGIATQASPGMFRGTFTFNGSESAMTMERVTESEIRQEVALAKASLFAPAITKPAATVPASCAVFSGKWTGTWSQGGVGQYWLWIAEVDDSCKAKIAYRDDSKRPRSFFTVEIKDGELRIPNRTTGGTSVFSRHGDDLWASYSNSSGGRNSAVFERFR